jgi:probable DNA metabolism protein
MDTICLKKGNIIDGLVYNGTLKKQNDSSGDVDAGVLSEDEILFQRLWKQYFRSICIDQRLNLKLHRQKVPKKYWKYLTEKKQEVPEKK